MAMTVYAMSCLKFAKATIANLTIAISEFWWNSFESKKLIGCGRRNSVYQKRMEVWSSGTLSVLINPYKQSKLGDCFKNLAVFK